MTRRVRCPSCGTTYLVPEDHPPGRRISCPKCGATAALRTAAPAEAPPSPVTPAAAPGATVFIPSPDAPPARRRRRLLAAAFLALAASVVAVAVAWPALKRWWAPAPVDPVEAVAAEYLRALVDDDAEALKRLGTIELPPAIRSFRDLRRDPARDVEVRGSFGPVAAFHKKVAEAYTFEPEIGRYTPRNPLGPAAETLDTLHAAKEQAEKSGLYDKIQSGDPEDLFDAAEGLAKSFSSLASGVLAPKKLLPTYEQLLDDAEPPLPPAERALARDFADNRKSWDALLGRPFTTIESDGPFVLEHAEVTAEVGERLGSLGDPPTPLRLTLTRFRLETLRTGWKVTAARREPPGGPPPSAPEPEPTGRRTSPGESTP